MKKKKRKSPKISKTKISHMLKWRDCNSISQFKMIFNLTDEQVIRYNKLFSDKTGRLPLQSAFSSIIKGERREF